MSNSQLSPRTFPSKLTEPRVVTVEGCEVVAEGAGRAPALVLRLRLGEVPALITGHQPG